MRYRYPMSSVHRSEGKPCLFCAYYDPEGYRRFRSTGTGSRALATIVCNAIDRASRLAKDGKLSPEKAQRVIRETRTTIAENSQHGPLLADAAEKTLRPIVEEFVRMAGGELTSYTVKLWLETWLAGKTDASKATLIEYRRIVDLFIKFLGTRADRPLSAVQPVQVERFKAHLAGRVGPSTVNKAVKVLKGAFGSAVDKRQLEFSPAEHVEFNATESSQRRAFTLPEIKTLLAAADDDWRTMILLGLYTGQRLQDCARLTWREVDLVQSVVSLRTQKTGREQVIPLAEPLARHLATLAGDDPDAPLCPALRGTASSRLSALFHRLMVKAGLAEARNHEGKGKGRDAARAVNTTSFHSLRHSATSLMKSAGVSDSVTMDIIGHETAAVSRSYTKIADGAKRDAVNKLPDVTV
ncbi:MAG: site-specific integrase [Proteobacteria bacterium]|nr:site-specific integrase [Pseudomonadota bacterium]